MTSTAGEVDLEVAATKFVRQLAREHNRIWPAAARLGARLALQASGQMRRNQRVLASISEATEGPTVPKVGRPAAKERAADVAFVLNFLPAYELLFGKVRARNNKRRDQQGTKDGTAPDVRSTRFQNTLNAWLQTVDGVPDAKIGEAAIRAAIKRARSGSALVDLTGFFGAVPADRFGGRPPRRARR